LTGTTELFISYVNRFPITNENVIIMFSCQYFVNIMISMSWGALGMIQE
jgi:hypothetical protein